MPGPPGIGAGSAFAPAFLGQIMEQKNRGLGDIGDYGDFCVLHDSPVHEKPVGQEQSPQDGKHDLIAPMHHVRRGKGIQGNPVGNHWPVSE